VVADAARGLRLPLAAPGGVLLLLVATVNAGAADAPRDADAAAGCRVVWTAFLPRDAELAPGVPAGGFSDLAADPNAADPDATERGSTDRGAADMAFWTVTDRGPNGTIRRDGKKIRTLLRPDFVPSLVRLRVETDGAARVLEIDRVVPLANEQGRPLSGRPLPGATDDSPLLAADGVGSIAADPHGVDTEAVVPLADGTFWLVEEYGPSLLHVAADGRVRMRLLPAGTAGGGRDCLPACYAGRRENRGFEALAASPDGTRLWVLLQSPLPCPAGGPKPSRAPGNVRLLACDARHGTPLAEYVYRLGDPDGSAYRSGTESPGDGKLCAIVALAADTLLVLEQDDAGPARLYAVGTAAASDTLGWRPASGTDALEGIRDLAAAGIVPVTKTLVADLTDLRAEMRGQADGGAPTDEPLKLEGLAVIDERHVAVLNDDDFGVHGPPQRRRRTCLWLVELPGPLPRPARSE